MNFKVGDIFTIDKKSYLVVLNDDEDTTLSGGLWCNKKCAFDCLNRCIGLLKDTGDCQPRFRSDKSPVYFLSIF